MEFLIQNSSLTSRWKSEADAYTRTAQKTHNEFVARKKEMRYSVDMQRFETSRFTEFKVAGLARVKDEAVKLYQEVIIVHFYDFYHRFEKWMSDLIKLHNDIMSVQKKLVDCEKDMIGPFERNEILLDSHIFAMVGGGSQTSKVATTPTLNHYLPATPSNTLSSSSFNGTTMSASSTSAAAAGHNVADTPPMSSTENTNLRNSSSVANSLDGSSIASNSSRLSRQHMDSLVAR